MKKEENISPKQYQSYPLNVPWNKWKKNCLIKWKLFVLHIVDLWVFQAPVQYHNYTWLQIGWSLFMNHNFKFCADPVEPEPQPSQGQESVHGHVCHCGQKAKSRSERFCVPTEKSRCLCVVKKIRCQAKCKCLNCDNYKRINEKLSCRCGESTASNKQNPEKKSRTDEPGQRRTRCPCYSNGRSCCNMCTFM